MLYADEEAYSIAADRAAAELAALDPLTVAAAKGAEFDPAAGVFRFALLGEAVEVTFPAGKVTCPSQRPVTGASTVLALHYLVYSGEPLRSEGWLAYRDLPAARHFAAWFEHAVEKRIADAFACNPAGLDAPAASLGGVPSDTGDRSFEIPALPRVPLLLVLWGDTDEVGGSCSVLFRPTAPTYLHTEDLAVLGVLLAQRVSG